MKKVLFAFLSLALIASYSCGGSDPAADTATGIVATPAISPDSDGYLAGQQVTITTSTSGATIYYTTDGSTPTTSSSKYTTPIALAADTTVKAYAVKESLTDSAVASKDYTIVTDNTAAATPAAIATDGQRHEQNIDVLGKNYYYKFTAQPGKIYSVRTYSEVDDFDTFIYLYSDATFTTELGENDDSCGQTELQSMLIIDNVTVPTTYYVRVQEYSDSDTGLFEIAVREINPTSLTVLDGTPVSLTNTVSDSDKYFSFSGLALKSYQFDIASTDVDLDMLISLPHIPYAPADPNYTDDAYDDEYGLASGGLSFGPGSYYGIDDTYYIYVESFDGTEGDYTLAVTEI